MIPLYLQDFFIKKEKFLYAFSRFHNSNSILGTPFIYRGRGWDFWKIIEGLRFSCKNGGSPYIVHIRGRGVTLLFIDNAWIL